jgi:hypothetical protein
MAPTGAPVVDRTTWGDLVRAVQAGSVEMLGALVEQPLVVVDLDTARPARGPPVRGGGDEPVGRS